MFNLGDEYMTGGDNENGCGNDPVQTDESATETKTDENTKTNENATDSGDAA